jgi:hypothetical protein
MGVSLSTDRDADTDGQMYMTEPHLNNSDEEAHPAFYIQLTVHWPYRTSRDGGPCLETAVD